MDVRLENLTAFSGLNSNLAPSIVEFHLQMLTGMNADVVEMPTLVDPFTVGDLRRFLFYGHHLLPLETVLGGFGVAHGLELFAIAFERRPYLLERTIADCLVQLVDAHWVFRLA